MTYDTDIKITLWGRRVTLQIWADQLSESLGVPITRARLKARFDYYKYQKGQPDGAALELAMKAIKRKETSPRRRVPAAQAERLFRGGMSLRAIGEQLGYSKTAISRAIKQARGIT